MKYVALLTIAILATAEISALTLSCEQDPEFSQYAEQASVEYLWDEDTWAIKIQAPASILNLSLASIQVYKGVDGSMLSVNLNTEQADSRVKAHFYASESMLDGMSLSFIYGKACLESFSVVLNSEDLDKTQLLE